MVNPLTYLRTNATLLAIALAAVILAFIAGDHIGANRVIARHAAERNAANVEVLTKDGAAKEAAAEQRAIDTANIAEKQDAQLNSIQGIDDAAIRRSAACNRLRAARGNQAAVAAGC